jgi:branched-chain amino acid transport system permease protein
MGIIVRRGVVPAAVVAAVAAPYSFGEYGSLIGSLAVIYSLVALGYVILTGWAGDVSLGQVVPYGLGAYATFWLSHTVGLPVGLAILLAPVITVPIMILCGLPALRLRGLELAVGTFALALVGQLMVFRSLGEWLSGGDINPSFARQVVPVGRPSFGPFELHSNRSFYLACLVLGGLAYLAVSILGRSPAGRTLRAIRDDPIRAQVMGVSVGRYRLAAFVAAGALAGLAGALLAALRQGVTPATFNIFESLNLLAVAILGGLATPRGALLGGTLGAEMPELSRFRAFDFLQGRLLFVYGASLVALLVFRPGGIASLLGWHRQPPIPLPDIEVDLDAELADGEGSPPPHPPLEIVGLSVTYGAFRAVDEVSFRIAAGETVALIGPNGAGKSTLIDAMTGLVSPQSGQVVLGGRDVTAVPPERRARLGLGRTFQTARVFPSLTATWSPPPTTMCPTSVNRSAWRPACSATSVWAIRRSVCPRACRSVRCGSSKWRWRGPPGPVSCCSTNRRRAWTRPTSNGWRSCSIV